MYSVTNMTADMYSKVLYLFLYASVDNIFEAGSVTLLVLVEAYVADVMHKKFQC